MKIPHITFACYMLNMAGGQTRHLVTVPFCRDAWTTEQNAARTAEDITGLAFDWMEYAQETNVNEY
jgi:hypothetical protein